MKTNEPTIQLNVEIPRRLYEQLKRVANAQGRKMKALVAEAIGEALRKSA